MPKITPKPREERAVVQAKTQERKLDPKQAQKWWLARSKKELCEQLLETAGFLKTAQLYRMRQAHIYARLYGNMPINSFVGSSNRFSNQPALAFDRPTMNVIQSCTDTLVSRLSQVRPRPVFLTDNGDYRERSLAKQLNQFIAGEFYRMKVHPKLAVQIRDACVLGSGVIHVFKKEGRVECERVMDTELFCDPNDAFYGDPRSIIRVKLVDRNVLEALFPEARGDIAKSEGAYVTETGDAYQTLADQIMVVEGWHLPSGKNAGDGRHVIACERGVIFEEEWKKDKFPFVNLPFSERLVGIWGQGLAEQLMGTQYEINKLLKTITDSINLVGVPRVFVEDGSKVLKAALNNMIGAIVTYQGTKPSYEVAPCVPAELYQQLQRLVEYAYQQSGISSLAAVGQKPAGLNSGTALREYNDIQSDRFANLQKKVEDAAIELAYLTIDFAKDIAEETGSYETVYPGKDGTRRVDLPASKLVENPFIIQCYNTSMLPRDPAGRLATITEYMQAGILTLKEGRRLMDFPDIEQDEKLANAPEERVLQQLDDIVESGKYSPPEPFTDILTAEKRVVQYINLYASAKLEESKMDMLRNYYTQLQTLKQAGAAPTSPPIDGGAAPLAVPTAPPVSPMLPNQPQ